MGNEEKLKFLILHHGKMLLCDPRYGLSWKNGRKDVRG
jgi:hypothetical protein